MHMGWETETSLLFLRKPDLITGITLIILKCDCIELHNDPMKLNKY